MTKKNTKKNLARKTGTLPLREPVCKIELTPLHYHEAADRCNSINEIIETMLMEHPVIAQNAELYRKISKAQEIIGDAYQKIGQLQGECVVEQALRKARG